MEVRSCGGRRKQPPRLMTSLTRMQGRGEHSLMASARDARVGSAARAAGLGRAGRTRGAAATGERRRRSGGKAGQPAGMGKRPFLWAVTHRSGTFCSPSPVPGPCKRRVASHRPRVARAQLPTAARAAGTARARCCFPAAAGRTWLPHYTPGDERPARALGSNLPRVPISCCAGQGGSRVRPSSWLHQPETSELKLHEIFMK